MLAAIRALVEGMTPRERERVLREVTEMLRPISLPRAGDTLGLVVQLLPRNREWTVKELKVRVQNQGAPISDKELYNALGYLTRKQHIQRVGQGRYMINGIPVVSADELGGEPSIAGGDLDD